MNEMTRPERAAQIRQAKRYKAAIRKKGTCCACQHREETFGIFHCRNKEDRRYPACNADDRGPKFTFDDDVLAKFRDAA